MKITEHVSCTIVTSFPITAHVSHTDCPSHSQLRCMFLIWTITGHVSYLIQTVQVTPNHGACFLFRLSNHSQSRRMFWYGLSRCSQSRGMFLIWTVQSLPITAHVSFTNCHVTPNHGACFLCGLSCHSQSRCMFLIRTVLSLPITALVFMRTVMSLPITAHVCYKDCYFTPYHSLCFLFGLSCHSLSRRMFLILSVTTFPIMAYISYMDCHFTPNHGMDCSQRNYRNCLALLSVDRITENGLSSISNTTTLVVLGKQVWL